MDFKGILFSVDKEIIIKFLEVIIIDAKTCFPEVLNLNLLGMCRWGSRICSQNSE